MAGFGVAGLVLEGEAVGARSWQERLELLRQGRVADGEANRPVRPSRRTAARKDHGAQSSLAASLGRLRPCAHGLP